MQLAVIVLEHPELKSLFTNVTQKPDQSGLEWFCEPSNLGHKQTSKFYY